MGEEESRWNWLEDELLLGLSILRSHLVRIERTCDEDDLDEATKALLLLKASYDRIKEVVKVVNRDIGKIKISLAETSDQYSDQYSLHFQPISGAAIEEAQLQRREVPGEEGKELLKAYRECPEPFNLVTEMLAHGGKDAQDKLSRGFAILIEIMNGKLAHEAGKAKLDELKREYEEAQKEEAA